MYSLSCAYLVDAVLLPPEERLGEHLPRLLHVELPGPQEAQEHRVRRNLVTNINMLQNSFSVFNVWTFNTHLPLEQLRYARLELHERRLLHRRQLAQVHLWRGGEIHLLVVD